MNENELKKLKESKKKLWNDSILLTWWWKIKIVRAQVATITITKITTAAGKKWKSKRKLIETNIVILFIEFILVENLRPIFYSFNSIILFIYIEIPTAFPRLFVLLCCWDFCKRRTVILLVFPFYWICFISFLFHSLSFFLYLKSNFTIACSLPLFIRM